jgi:hypothetical protein
MAAASFSLRTQTLHTLTARPCSLNRAASSNFATYPEQELQKISPHLRATIVTSKSGGWKEGQEQMSALVNTKLNSEITKYKDIAATTYFLQWCRRSNKENSKLQATQWVASASGRQWVRVGGNGVSVVGPVVGNVFNKVSDKLRNNR